MKRSEIFEKLSPHNGETNIRHALEVLAEQNYEHLSNEDVHRVWDFVSKSLDQKYSSDKNNPLWGVEIELSKSYKYPCGRTGFEVLNDLNT